MQLRKLLPDYSYAIVWDGTADTFEATVASTCICFTSRSLWSMVALQARQKPIKRANRRRIIFIVLFCMMLWRLSDTYSGFAFQLREATISTVGSTFGYSLSSCVSWARAAASWTSCEVFLIVAPTPVVKASNKMINFMALKFKWLDFLFLTT